MTTCSRSPHSVITQAKHHPPSDPRPHNIFQNSFHILDAKSNKNTVNTTPFIIISLLYFKFFSSSTLLGCIYSPAEDPHSVLGHSVSLAQRGDVGNEHRCCQFTVISCMRRNWRAASRWHHPKSSSEINTESFAQVEI